MRTRRRHPPDPRSRPPKGHVGPFTRVRRAVWSWWPWSLLAVWLVSAGSWLWASGAALMALLSYLISPRTEPPRFGLEHEFTPPTASR